MEKVFDLRARAYLVTAIVRQITSELRHNVFDWTISRNFPELVEHLTGGDVIRYLSFKPVIEESVDAWSDQPPLTEIFSPH